MATISGRVTVVAADSAEFATLHQQAIDGPPYTLVSSDESSLTLVVDISGG